METSEVEKFSLKNFLSKKGSMTVAGTVAALSVGTLILSNSVADGDKTVLGIRADGQNIGGMDKVSVEKIFTNIAAQKIHELKFRYGDEEFVITPEDIALNPLVDKATQEAFNYGRGGSAIGNFNEQIKCFLNGRNVQLAANFDSTLLDEKLNAIAAQVNKDPVNAVVEFSSNGAIEKIPGVIGKKLNR